MIKGFIAGNFDVIHPGYIKLFKECKENCDHFTVLLHSDPSIERKHKLKPILSLDERKEMLFSLKYVDDIMILVNKMGVHSNYTGIMNIDVLIHKEKPHLLEVNPRFSGSIYISMNTSLLKDLLFFF
mgnify:CR=1 FL=1